MQYVEKANYIIDMHDAAGRKRSIYVATEAVYCLPGTACSGNLDVNEDDTVWNSLIMGNGADDVSTILIFSVHSGLGRVTGYQVIRVIRILAKTYPFE